MKSGYRIPLPPKSHKIRTFIGEVLYVMPYGNYDYDYSTEIRAEVVGSFGGKIIGRVTSSSVTDVPYNTLVELIGYTL